MKKNSDRPLTDKNKPRSPFTDKDKQRSPLPFLTRKKRSPLTDKDKQRSPPYCEEKSDRLLQIKKTAITVQFKIEKSDRRLVNS